MVARQIHPPVPAAEKLRAMRQGNDARRHQGGHRGRGQERRLAFGTLPRCRAKTPRDVTSRPSVRDDAPSIVDDIVPIEDTSSEVEMLRAQNDAFLKSVQALQARNIELNAELVALRSKHELQSAMAAQAKPPAEPLTMEKSIALLNEAAKNKMPWEG